MRIIIVTGCGGVPQTTQSKLLGVNSLLANPHCSGEGPSHKKNIRQTMTHHHKISHARTGKG